MALDPEVVRRLRGVVGEGAVLLDRDRLMVYESDGLTQYRVAPVAVVLPGRSAEVPEILRILHEAGLLMIPRGAGTGLSGGALAIQGGVMVGTARLNRILDVDAVNRRARVEPGVVNASLTRATVPHGLVYAPDPSSQSACTLGGNVAENSGGPHCLKYGVTSRYVTRLTVALPSGEVLRLGGPETEGELDLVGAFVGSEGCFGLATEIEVGLIPAPPGVRTLLGIFESMEAASHAVTGIMAQGLLPAALEIVDQATIQAVEASVFAAGFPVDAGAALVVEFDGVEAGLDRELEAAAATCREAGAREVRLAATGAERDALWRGRKKAFGAMGRIAPDLLVQDATVPRSRLPQVLARIAEIGRKHDLALANVFHAGDGNLHPNLLFDRRDPDQLARVEAASREIMAVCIEAGGTITGEHGVGVDKRGYLPLVCSPPVLRVMGELRRIFDPEGRSNPGKVLPDGWGPPWPARPPMPDPDPEGDRSGSAPGLPGPVLEYEPADLVIRVRADVSLEQLAEIVAESGQWLPFDPPGGSAQSIGDAVARGRSGALQAGFGRIRDHVLGATFRTHAGERLELGGRVVKNVAGFDLLRLVVGSGHRLGHFEEVTLRLFPRPEVDRTLVWTAEDGEGEGGGPFRLGAALAATGAPVEALSWFRGGSLPGGVVGARLLGSREAVAHVEALLRRAAESVAGMGPGGPGGPGVALSGGESTTWWEARAAEAAEPASHGDSGPWVRVRTAGRPSEGEALLRSLTPLVAEAEVEAEMDGWGSTWAASHLLVGGVELRVPAARLPARGTAERRSLADRVREAGGGLVVDDGAAEPGSATPDPVRRRILDQVEALFRSGQVGGTA